MIRHKLIEVTGQIGRPREYQDGLVRDGILSVAAVCFDSDGVCTYETFPPKEDLPILKEALLQAAELARVTFRMNGTDRLIANLSPLKYKFVAEVYGDFVIVVVVQSGHDVNKSISRIIHRASRRAGLKKVESKEPWNRDRQSNEQPAASLGTQVTGESLQSAEARTPVTGASQAEESNDSKEESNSPPRPLPES